MSNANNIEDTPILVTDQAAERIIECLQDEEDADKSLRVYIQGGGCAGFEYVFTFTATQNPDDMEITKFDNLQKKSVRIIVDPLSLTYLQGATIDYIRDLHGARFIVNNPNATTTCGCGSSFAT